jgi:heme-degrading monooxygenase HmoA
MRGTSAVILRLFRSGVPTGAEAAHVQRLRERIIPRLRETPGLLAWTHGFRYASSGLQALTLSCWADYDAILAATRNDPSAAVHDVPIDDIVSDVRIDHYELAQPFDAGIVELDGAVIGMITATTTPRTEAVVQEMVRNVRPRVFDAGAVALQLGRRVTGKQTEIVILAVWTSRLAMDRWARSRPEGAVDPAFLANLEAWSFETFDCLSPGDLAHRGDGPAVLVVDGSLTLVDASRGVEAILGVPGELLLGRRLGDLVRAINGAPIGVSGGVSEPGTPTLLEPAFRILVFGETGEARGELALAVPGSLPVTSRYRAAQNVPIRGLQSIVLVRPGTTDSRRRIAALVREALPTSAPAA